ncbi:hypothetical protein IK112_03800 [Candidatus Saccharibacteria bacterium]|nr:hypothetical protein [Candidatus Saccharibacteria bacterium]
MLENTIPLHLFCYFSYFTSARRYPLSYVLPGVYWGTGTLEFQDTDGRYWSSTSVNNSSEAYYMYILINYTVSGQFTNNKANLLTLR